MARGSRFLPEVERILRKAGWYPGRTIPAATIERWANRLESPAGYQFSGAAWKVLAEFGDLHIGAVGIGKDYASMDLHVDPVLCTDEEERFRQAVGKPVFPIGDASGSHLFSAVDDDGVLYLVWEYEVVGDPKPFDNALQALLLGRR